METRAQLGAVPRAVIVFALIALLTLVMATAIAIGASNPPKLPPPFGAAGNGLIAYVSDGDIHVVEPDGTAMRQITSTPEEDVVISWSRDGTQLAYWSIADDGSADLFVTDAQGGDPVALAHVEGEATGETWSEDGSEIMYSAIVPGLGADPCPVFDFQGGACGSRLFVAKADGTGSRPVGDPALDARGPALSPDGTTVAFGGGEAASEALYLIDWDGSNITRLDGVEPAGGWAVAKQSWSADGDLIVTHDGGASQRIWLVARDGSGASVVEALGENFWPSYAPDGSGIVWATGSGQMIWTPGDAEEPAWLSADSLVWAPDGSQLVGRRGGSLLLVDRDGRDIATLGTFPADDGGLSWQRVAE